MVYVTYLADLSKFPFHMIIGGPQANGAGLDCKAPPLGTSTTVTSVPYGALLATDVPPIFAAFRPLLAYWNFQLSQEAASGSALAPSKATLWNPRVTELFTPTGTAMQPQPKYVGANRPIMIGWWKWHMWNSLRPSGKPQILPFISHDRREGLAQPSPSWTDSETAKRLHIHMSVGSHLESGSFWRPASTTPEQLCFFGDHSKSYDLTTGIMEEPPTEKEDLDTPEPPGGFDPPYPTLRAAEAAETPSAHPPSPQT